MAISNFTATPYNQGVLLNWFAGRGVINYSAELITTTVDRTLTTIGHWINGPGAHALPTFSANGVLNLGAGAGPLDVIGYQWGGLPPESIGDGGLYAFHYGKTYKITYTYAQTTAGFRFQIGSINQIVGPLEVGVGNTVTFTCIGEGTHLMVVATGLSAAGTLDDVSLVEVYSSIDDTCEITIQYTTSDVPNVIPNTPPYVVRNLRQNQLTNNALWHPNLKNDTPYTYSIFVHYLDTGEWQGPLLSPPVTPLATLSTPLTSVSGSFSKLGTNTRLQSVQDSMTEIVVWMADSQESNKTKLEEVVKKIAPAHVRVNIVYEPYYVAHTTTDQFTTGDYNSGSYTITEGTIKITPPTSNY